MRLPTRYKLLMWVRRLSVAVTMGWCAASQILLVQLLLMGISLVVVVCWWDSQVLSDFYSYWHLRHFYLILHSVVQAFGLWAVVVPLVCFIVTSFIPSKNPLRSGGVSRSRLYAYVICSFLWIPLMCLLLPIAAIHGSSYVFTEVLPAAVFWVGTAMVCGAGVAAYIRRAMLKRLSDIDVGIIPDYLPHHDTVYLACAFLSPQIRHVDKRMRMWKRVEEYLGAPDKALEGFLLHGTVGSDCVRGPVREFLARGPWGGIEGVRDRVAKAVKLRGKNPTSRVAMVGSATSAFTYAIRGIVDTIDARITIIRSDWEYDTIEGEIQQVAKDKAPDIELVQCQVYGNGLAYRGSQAIVEDCVTYAALSLEGGGHCIFCMSQVINETGTILPLAQVYSAVQSIPGAQDRLHFIIDGAHALAHIPVDLSAMPNSIFVWSGHKWLLGPHGTGGLAIGERVSNTVVTAIKRQTNESFAFSSNEFLQSPELEKRRKWLAGVDASRFIGLGASFDVHDVLCGSDGADVFARKAGEVLKLRRVFERELDKAFRESDVRILINFSDDAGLEASLDTHVVSPGIVTFSLMLPQAEILNEQLVSALGKYHIVCNYLQRTGNIRISLSPFITEDDLVHVSRVIADEAQRLAEA